MSTAKTKKGRSGFGARIIAGLEEALAIEKGELKPARVTRVPLTARKAETKTAPMIDAKRIVSIRKSLELSQPVFAGALNVKPATVKAWEIGQKKPSGAALRLLQLTEKHPKWLLSMVQVR